jgi:hypothetical protein
MVPIFRRFRAKNFQYQRHFRDFAEMIWEKWLAQSEVLAIAPERAAHDEKL